MFCTQKGACLLQAHRGVSTEHPENTLSAFWAAVEQGYDIIELDPNVTADGVAVVLHDNTVNRTARQADGTPLAAPTPIRALSYSQAAKLDFGGYFSPRFKGEPLPTLTQVLQLSAETGVKLKLDNKIQSFTAEEKAIIFNTVAAHPACKNVGFTCSSLDYLKQVATLFPNNPLHYDGAPTESYFQTVKSLTRAPLTVWLRYDNTHTAWSALPSASPELCKTAKRYGSLGLWLLSTEDEATRAVDFFGADVIETTGAIKPCR